MSPPDDDGNMTAMSRIAAAVIALSAVSATVSDSARADDDPSPFWAAPDPDHRIVSHEENWQIPLLHTHGMMTSMRIGLAVLFPEPFANDELLDWAGHYGEALRMPPRWEPDNDAFEWDGDSWPLNVLGHGVFGSELYMRARTCRASLPAALMFAAAQSAVWEYVYEGNAVRPSLQDLWFTPVAGAVLGELRFAAWYGADKLAEPWRSIISVGIDPFGELERALGTVC